MKKKIYLLLVVALFACNSNKTGESTNSDTTKITTDTLQKNTETKETEEITYTPFESKEKHVLNENLPEANINDLIKKYLTPSEQEFFKNAKKLYSEIKTSKELAYFYTNILNDIHNIISLGMQRSDPDVVYSGDDRPAQRWKKITDYFPFLQAECLCSECSSESVTDLVPFTEIAKKTPENEDDLYFAALYKMYYDENNESGIVLASAGNIANWYTLDNCDVCSYSNMGSNEIYEILKAFDNALDAGTSFKKDIEMKRSFVIPYKGQMHFGYSKDEVEKEIKKIMKDIKLSEEEKKNFQELLGALNDADKQFNCKDGGCNY